MNILFIIILLIFILLGLSYVIWQVKKNGLRGFIVECIVYAEDHFENNKVKFEAVCNMVINKLPFPFNMIPSSFIADFVQKVFDDVKIALDYQKKE